MATTQKQWKLAFDLLSQFERDLINPNEFKWSYFVTNVGVSKQTFMRNSDFLLEFNRVRSLVKKYKNEKNNYSLEKSIKSKRDQEFSYLNEKIKLLTDELDLAREQLAYATLIALKNNIDPIQFVEKSPLLLTKEIAREKEEKNIIESNDVLKRLRAKKNEQSGKS